MKRPRDHIAPEWKLSHVTLPCKHPEWPMRCPRCREEGDAGNVIFLRGDYGIRFPFVACERCQLVTLDQQAVDSARVAITRGDVWMAVRTCCPLSEAVREGFTIEWTTEDMRIDPAGGPRYGGRSERRTQP